MRRVNEDVEGQTVHQNSHSATRVKSRKSVSRSSELICCRTLSPAVSRTQIEPLSALPSFFPLAVSWSRIARPDFALCSDTSPSLASDLRARSTLPEVSFSKGRAGSAGSIELTIEDFGDFWRWTLEDLSGKSRFAMRRGSVAMPCRLSMRNCGDLDAVILLRRNYEVAPTVSYCMLATDALATSLSHAVVHLRAIHA
jgi:hypothetical protein